MDEDSGRQRLVLKPDYGAPAPLWIETPTGRRPVSATVLGLSSRLVGKLSDWQRLFDERYNWDAGWATPADLTRYLELGRELTALLTAELRRSHTVIAEFE